MIQEKDFLYRVPVKTAPITTPGGQIRNPEILVDLEGGKFMHGNILDANSTNKLINQSVKDAVDNKLIESGYVTQDLLDAETSARTKGDEDLSAKIKAEQTRAEGKEKEISDKLAIVDGDSNTEGSFRKAIADVVAAAPEDLDTLKEIADKLAGNDDLHTALNQAITEKADASALANEVTRATGAESGLQAAIATKADATALSNYVLTTALNQQVGTLNTAISAKQDAGDYIPYCETNASDYTIDKGLVIKRAEDTAFFNTNNIQSISNSSNTKIEIFPSGITMKDDDDTIRLNRSGVTLPNGSQDYVLTSNGSTININSYATKSNLSEQLGPKADRSDLAALEQKVTANTTALEGKQNKGNYMEYSSAGDSNYIIDKTIIFNTTTNNTKLGAGFMTITHGSGVDKVITKYSSIGIQSSKYNNCLATSDGTFKPISDFVLKTELPSDLPSVEDISNLQVGLSKKQDKITVNEVDVTDIETADITKLRTIVTNLINALSESGLIRETETIE